MNIVNYIFHLIFMPFQGLNSAVGLFVVSVLTGIVMLIIFRYTSNQKGIEQVKNRIKAYFLEMKLYR